MNGLIPFDLEAATCRVEGTKLVTRPFAPVVLVRQADTVMKKPLTFRNGGTDVAGMVPDPGTGHMCGFLSSESLQGDGPRSSVRPVGPPHPPYSIAPWDASAVREPLQGAAKCSPSPLLGVT